MWRFFKWRRSPASTLEPDWLRSQTHHDVHFLREQERDVLYCGVAQLAVPAVMLATALPEDALRAAATAAIGAMAGAIVANTVHRMRRQPRIRALLAAHGARREHVTCFRCSERGDPSEWIWPTGPIHLARYPVPDAECLVHPGRYPVGIGYACCECLGHFAFTCKLEDRLRVVPAVAEWSLCRCSLDAPPSATDLANRTARAHGGVLPPGDS